MDLTGDALPRVGTLAELTDLVRTEPDLCVRYSAGPGHDARQRSMDTESGLELPGLSVNPLAAEGWWTRPLEDWLARQLCQYKHLAERDPERRAWILRGVIVGRGPDCEPLLGDVAPVAVLDPALLAEAEVRYQARFDAGVGPEDREQDSGVGAAVVLSRLSSADAAEVLTLQRAAFVSEALIYGTADMPPLTQTLGELRAELMDTTGWAAREGARLVGALRARRADDLLLIGRISIAPDKQGEGIGRLLLETAERASGARVAELFTGSLSEANIRLYERCGYRVTERVDQGDGTAQVFLRKLLDPVAT
ncbi:MULTISPECIES: DUF6098 family protein [Bacteria]|uniref:DUF6098 family protein n=1 Tax=Bacteria TaxID=2 RepID=UPI003C7AC654